MQPFNSFQVCCRQSFCYLFVHWSLGESIAANNAYRQREAELSIKRVAVQEGPPPRTNTSVLDSSYGSSKGVHSLAEKIQSGLEVQHVYISSS